MIVSTWYVKNLIVKVKFIKKDPKKFGSYIKEQRSAKKMLINYNCNGQTVTRLEAANAFVDFFKSVFLKEEYRLLFDDDEKLRWDADL